MVATATMVNIKFMSTITAKLPIAPTIGTIMGSFMLGRKLAAPVICSKKTTKYKF